jgi:hypothetical protein
MWKAASSKLIQRNSERIIPLVLNAGYKRSISSREALRVLGMKSPSYTTRELRDAYFTAAKQCHPDVAKSHQQEWSTTSNDNNPIDTGERFRLITIAYERLKSSTLTTPDEDGSSSVPQDDQMHYRAACDEVLGVPAEIVEECKRDPKFRHWLGGNTDAAIFWRNFFAVHGGLAPMLDEPAGLLGSNEKHTSKINARRKRAPRR